jgi:cysteine desulfurase
MARMTPIYLDHAATTPMLPAVANAMREASLRYGANPASQHELGRQARRALETARSRIAELLGAGPDDQLVFTSGGTESNNLAITGLFGWHAQGPPPGVVRGQFVPASTTPRADLGVPPRIVISSQEHPSVYRAADHLAEQGVVVDRLPVSREGVTQVGAISNLLSTETRLVSIILGSNETGVLQPAAEIAAVCRERRIPIHTDATQVVGKLPVDFRKLGVDALTFAAHKFHGPIGIGGLLVRHGGKLAPSLHGGFQQAALRPGTESVPLALGMLAALELWYAEAEERRDRIESQRDLLEAGLWSDDEGAVVIGSNAARLPHISNVAFTGLDRQALAMALDLAGIACSTGSACASGSSEPSPALVAMGLPDEQISGSIRFSLGATTTPAEIDEGCRRILSVVKRLRRG